MIHKLLSLIMATPSLVWEKVNAIDVPILSFTGTNDDGITPVMNVHDAMEILDRELKQSPRKKLIVYDGANHNFEGFEEKIIDDTLQFIHFGKQE